MQSKLKRILLDHLSILRVKRGKESLKIKSNKKRYEFYDNKIKEVEEIIEKLKEVEFE